MSTASLFDFTPPTESPDAWSGQTQAMFNKAAYVRLLEENGVDVAAIAEQVAMAFDDYDESDELPETVTRSAQISVTYHDIINGIPGNVYIDPCGLAVKRCIPFSYKVRVSYVDIAFSIKLPGGDAVRYVVETPAEVAAWLVRYDARKSVRPMTFDLVWTEEA